MTPGSLVSPDLMVVLILWPQFSEEFERKIQLLLSSVPTNTQIAVVVPEPIYK